MYGWKAVLRNFWMALLSTVRPLLQRLRYESRPFRSSSASNGSGRCRRSNTCAAMRRVTRTTKRHGLQYAVMDDGVGIAYELLGPPDGLPCIFTPGGRGGRDVFRQAAEYTASRGFRCLIHDRRNCGASDVGFGDGTEPEARLQVADTLALLDHLGMAPAVFVGNSSGARLSVMCQLEAPEKVRALLLMNMTAGPGAAAELAWAYHGQFARLCRDGGMPAVATAGHFQLMACANADVRKGLLRTDPAVFLQCHDLSEELMRASASYPVVGITAEQLQSIQCPVFVAFSMTTCDDGMHTLAAAENLVANIPTASQVFVPKEDRPNDPELLDKAIEFCSKIR